ncbi:hypothetical protein SAMN05519104_2751 [Rhizobiales bacterium GAS188]|nr:hypothetical protein SAMN05519104_2751 [Rhizobiales bacterium GAS188]
MPGLVAEGQEAEKPTEKPEQKPAEDLEDAARPLAEQAIDTERLVGQSFADQSVAEPIVAQATSEAGSQSPWSAAGREASPPVQAAQSQPYGERGRSLALAALALSILLPAVLYGYLSMSGALDRDDSRLARLESSVATLRAAPPAKPEIANPEIVKPEVTRADLDKLGVRIDTLEKTVTALRQRPESPAAAAPAPSPAPLAAEIQAATRDAKDALEQAKAASASAGSAQAALARLATLDARVEGLEKLIANVEKLASTRPKDAANAPSILVMARAVATDLGSNLPYGGELDALARLGADPKSVEALRPFADKGAPSPAALAADFQGELNAARAKVADAVVPTSLWDRSMAMLGRLVRVRRIGADEPGTPAATVENALTRGDIAAARDAWNALPVFEKGATPASGARITALANAHDAARRIGADALEAMRRAGTAGSGG